MSETVRETCACGAEWFGPRYERVDRETWREAHAVCRKPRDDDELVKVVREAGVAIAEAILAGAEYSEDKEHARSLVGELSG